MTSVFNESENQFIRTFLGACFLFSASMAGFSFFIDPYGAFGSPQIPGINKNKPFMKSQERNLGKPGAVRFLKPKGLILGSSRGERGLDPEHPGWKVSPVYNLSTSGSNIYEVMRLFHHAQSVQPLQTVLIGLDFYQFNVYWKKDKGFNENLLSGGNLLWRVFEIFKISLSMETFWVSVKTLRAQSESTGFDTNGFSKPVTEPSDQRKLFFNEAKGVSNMLLPDPGMDYAFKDENTGENSLYYYQGILETAYRDGVDLKLFISPSHAWHWETLRISRLWNRFEEWKRQLVKFNEETALKHNAKPFPLWDFSGYNSYTTESVPPHGEIKNMKWYFESSHYRPTIGDRIQDILLGHTHSSRDIAKNFGVPITSKNIEEHLAFIRRTQEAYQKNNANDLREVETLYENSLEKRKTKAGA